MQTAERKLMIKLISPKMSLRPMDSEYKRRLSPSLSLVTLATLTPSPHSVHIDDENLQPIHYEDDIDVVGITVNVDTSYRAFEIAHKFRQKGAKVIFGGIHASANADEMLMHCDAVCIGEAENTWPLILKDIADGRLQPKYYNNHSVELDKVPLPNWNFISKKDYLYHNIIVTSRGCPFKCEFCYNSCEYVDHSYRNRPIESVIEEVKALKMRQVMFIDDNFIGNIKWTNALLDELGKLNVIWHAAVSTNLVHHPEMIEKMASTGCRSLFIGFESVNQHSIQSVNKKQNKIQDYERLIYMLHRQNIMVNASLVFGFDFDTKETFSETLEWLVRNKVETMTGHVLTPYPGTALYKRLLQEGRIIDFNLRKYNTANVVFAPKNLTAEELQKGYLRFYDDFYSFKNIIRRMPENKKIIPSYLTFNLLYRKFGKLTSLLGKAGLMSAIGRTGRKLSYGMD